MLKSHITRTGIAYPRIAERSMVLQGLPPHCSRSALQSRASSTSCKAMIMSAPATAATTKGRRGRVGEIIILWLRHAGGEGLLASLTALTPHGIVYPSNRIHNHFRLVQLHHVVALLSHDQHAVGR